MDCGIALFTGLIRTRKQFGFPVFGMPPEAHLNSDRWSRYNLPGSISIRNIEKDDSHPPHPGPTLALVWYHPGPTLVP